MTCGVENMILAGQLTVTRMTIQRYKTQVLPLITSALGLSLTSYRMRRHCSESRALYAFTSAVF